MIRATLTAMLALSGSILLHAGAMLGLPETQPEPLAGGMGSAPPLLGDSFADLAEGMAVAVAASLAHTTRSPTALTPVSPRSAPAVPQTAEGLAPIRAETAPANNKNSPVSAIRPTPAPRLQARPDPPPLVEAAPSETEPKARPKPPAAKGSETAARKGVATGRTTAKASTGQGQQTAEASGGLAASASYGNAVMRKIARTRKKSTTLRGTAVVSFKVTPNGQIATVGIARSSGHAELDRLGVDHIRRAAPFPAPPPGANTRFSVEFRGR